MLLVAVSASWVPVVEMPDPSLSACCFMLSMGPLTDASKLLNCCSICAGKRCISCMFPPTCHPPPPGNLKARLEILEGRENSMTRYVKGREMICEASRLLIDWRLMCQWQLVQHATLQGLFPEA
jgi:hypothetical protein